MADVLRLVVGILCLCVLAAHGLKRQDREVHVMTVEPNDLMCRVCVDYHVTSSNWDVQSSVERELKKQGEALGGPCSRGKTVGPCSQCQTVDTTQVMTVSGIEVKQTIHQEICAFTYHTEDGRHGIESEDGQKVEKALQGLKDIYRESGMYVSIHTEHFETTLCGVTKRCEHQGLLNSGTGHSTLCHRCVDISYTGDSTVIRAMQKGTDAVLDEKYDPKCRHARIVQCGGQCTLMTADLSLSVEGYDVDANIVTKGCTMINGKGDVCLDGSDSDNGLVRAVKTQFAALDKYTRSKKIDVCLCSDHDSCNSDGHVVIDMDDGYQVVDDHDHDQDHHHHDHDHDHNRDHDGGHDHGNQRQYYASAATAPNMAPIAMLMAAIGCTFFNM